jgi:hypothetical protein
MYFIIKYNVFNKYIINVTTTEINTCKQIFEFGLHIKLKIEQHEPTKDRGEPRGFGRVSSFCSTTLVTNPVVCHESEKDRIVITPNGTYPWSFETDIP